MFSCPDCKADRSRVLPVDPCPGCGALLLPPAESLDVTAERAIIPKGEEVLVSAHGVSASIARTNNEQGAQPAMDPEDDPDVFDPNATVVEDSTGTADTLAELLQPEPIPHDDQPTRIDKKVRATIPPIIPVMSTAMPAPKTVDVAALAKASATLPSVAPPPGVQVDDPTIRITTPRAPSDEPTVKMAVAALEDSGDTTDNTLVSAFTEQSPNDAMARTYDGRPVGGPASGGAVAMDGQAAIHEAASSTLPGMIAVHDTLESSMSTLEQARVETPMESQAVAHELVEPVLLDRKRESPFDTRPPDASEEAEDSVDVFTKTVSDAPAVVDDTDDPSDVLTRTSMDPPPDRRSPSEVIPTPSPGSVVGADRYLPSVIVTPAEGAQMPAQMPAMSSPTPMTPGGQAGMQPVGGMQPPPAAGMQPMHPGLPAPIGPPPNDTSYPVAALDALVNEQKPKGAVNQAVWREAHPSARRWATERRSESSTRSPQPLSIAVGLLLTGLGCYLLAVFLPSKAPSAAAAKLAATAGQGSWHFSTATHSAANINAALIIVLGIVIVVRGALHRPRPGKSKDFSKLTLALIAAFLALGAWFGVSVLTASMG